MSTLFSPKNIFSDRQAFRSTEPKAHRPAHAAGVDALEWSIVVGGIVRFAGEELPSDGPAGDVAVAADEEWTEDALVRALTAPGRCSELPVGAAAAVAGSPAPVAVVGKLVDAEVPPVALAVVASGHRPPFAHSADELFRAGGQLLVAEPEAMAAEEALVDVLAHGVDALVPARADRGAPGVAEHAKRHGAALVVFVPLPAAG